MADEGDSVLGWGEIRGKLEDFWVKERGIGKVLVLFQRRKGVDYDIRVKVEMNIFVYMDICNKDVNI